MNDLICFTFNNLHQLGELSAISTACFVVGPSLGAILYKIDPTLPALVSGVLFGINSLIVMQLIPNIYSSISSIVTGKTMKTHEVKTCGKEVNVNIGGNREVTSYNSLVKDAYQLFTVPGIFQIFFARGLIQFIEGSMSSRHILNYHQVSFD